MLLDIYFKRKFFRHKGTKTKRINLHCCSTLLQGSAPFLLSKVVEKENKLARSGINFVFVNRYSNVKKSLYSFVAKK
jgi:hypothetical protein